MSLNLNQLEIALLTSAALNPKPKVSWADRKRIQRQKAKTRTPDGCLLVTAENIHKAILDALSEAIRTGQHDLPITDIIRQASTRFPIPVIAEARIRQRLAARKPSQQASQPEGNA